MKNIFTLLLILFLMTNIVYSQNWETLGGNPQRSGVSKLTGPATANLYWTVNSTNSTTWGNNIYTFGDKFVNSRVILSPYTSKVELRNLTNGALIWAVQVTDSSIMYAVGFNEDAVYANDYKTSMLYALRISDGGVKWSVPSSMFGGNAGIQFAPDGDVIIYGKRIDKKSGQVKWTNNYIIPIGPDDSYCLYGNTYYHWTGSIVTPKTLIAIDLTTGLTKYTSSTIPGGAGQQNPLKLGPNGIIYITRDAGNLFAYQDNGTGFTELWDISPGFIVKGFSNDGKIYTASPTGRLVRLNAANGQALDSTADAYAANFYSATTTGADSTVYFNTGETGTGRYIAFTPNLQTTKWTFNAAYNYYSRPSLGKEGVLVMVGAGTTITAYKTALTNLKPVVDFYADSNVIYQGSAIDFFDQSSYIPTSWQWTFTGSNTPTSTQHNPTNIVYPAAGTYDVKLIATNSFGQDTLIRAGYIVVKPFIGIKHEGKGIADRFVLYQNYPNPFNPKTNIKYNIPSTGFVTMKIFDVFGKEIAILVNETQNEGSYIVEWDATNYPSGVYFYRLITKGFSDVKKLILLK